MIKITTETIRAMKTRGEKIAALTAYDYPMAKLLDEAGVPLLLVGDSLGMVVLGYPDTTHVTMAEMEHHVRAVARAKPRALVAAVPVQEEMCTSFERPPANDFKFSNVVAAVSRRKCISISPA